MKLEFSCPWCGADTELRGAGRAPWRFRIPCDLCDQNMVVTWDGELNVSRSADDKPRWKQEEETVRFAYKIA